MTNNKYSWFILQGLTNTGGKRLAMHLETKVIQPLMSLDLKEGSWVEQTRNVCRPYGTRGQFYMCLAQRGGGREAFIRVAQSHFN